VIGLFEVSIHGYSRSQLLTVILRGHLDLKRPAFPFGSTATSKVNPTLTLSHKHPTRLFRYSMSEKSAFTFYQLKLAKVEGSHLLRLKESQLASFHDSTSKSHPFRKGREF